MEARVNSDHFCLFAIVSLIRRIYNLVSCLIYEFGYFSFF